MGPNSMRIGGAWTAALGRVCCHGGALRAAALAVGLTWLCFGKTLGYGLLWDDHVWVDAFRRQSLIDLLHANLASTTLGHSYYRPLAALTLSLQLALLNHALWLHAFNVALHAVNLLLLVALVSRTAPASAAGPVLPVGTALLAMHPLVVEPVAWVSGRFELLYSAFLLAAILAATAPWRYACRATVAGIAFFLALCCKESALVYLVVGPAFVAWLQARAGDSVHSRRMILQAALLDVLPLVAAVLTYVAIRVVWLRIPLFQGAASSARLYADAFEHVVLVLRTLGTYVQLALVPLWNLAPLHPAYARGIAAHAYVLTGLAAVALAIVGCTRRAWIPVTFYIAALMPAANVVPLGLEFDYVQNRYAYFALMLAGATIMIEPPRILRGGPWRAGCAAAALVMAHTTVSTTHLWRDGVTLFTWALTSRPRAPMVINNLAAEHYFRGAYDRAIEIQRRLPDDKRSFRGWLLLARAARARGEPAAAVPSFERALAIGTDDDTLLVSALYELALAERECGDAGRSRGLAAAADHLAARTGMSARLRDAYHRELDLRPANPGTR
jgi:tetratricopeptide (TPR) repeat protein